MRKHGCLAAERLIPVSRLLARRLLRPCEEFENAEDHED
jgi:hypothetical protein